MPPPNPAPGSAPAPAPGPRGLGFPGVHLLAVALAWVFPGLGHLILGRRDRGLVLAAAITSVYLAGIAIGGIAVIDRRDHPAWFVSQALIAPSFLIDRHHQAVRDAATRATGRRPDATGAADSDLYRPAFGRAQEQGTLYTAAAGLLNLLAMLDAVSRRPGHERRQSARREQERAVPAPATPA